MLWTHRFNYFYFKPPPVILNDALIVTTLTKSYHDKNHIENIYLQKDKSKLSP